VTPALTLQVTASDGHRFELLHVAAPAPPSHHLLWLPALGVSARHYLPFAQALSQRGCSVTLHEWRGHGSSKLRASRARNWGFAQLLATDLPAVMATLNARGLPVDTLGGHSLGGQLSCCFASQILGLQRLWLVASGSPHWASFPPPHRYWLPLAYTLLPGMALVLGHLPGRRLGFGGREARRLVADWARVGRTGRYRIPAQVQQDMAGLDLGCIAVCLEDDWMAPASSLKALRAWIPGCRHQTAMLTAAQLGVAANHFAWIRHPAAIAEALL